MLAYGAANAQSPERCVTPPLTGEEAESLLARFGAGNPDVIEFMAGEVEVDGRKLKRRDGLGISAQAAISITAGTDAELLAIEVPLT